jgi:hypothetical protein
MSNATLVLAIFGIIACAWIVFAFVVRWSTRLVGGFLPRHGQIFKAMLICGLMMVAIRRVIGFMTGKPSQSVFLDDDAPFLIAFFLTQAVVFGMVLKNPSEVPLGFVRAIFVALIVSLARYGADEWLAPRIIESLKPKEAPAETQNSAPDAVGPSVNPSSPAQRFASVADAQKEAVRLYPSLGVSGSLFNGAFLTLHRKYQKENPGYFDDNSWPLLLAEEVARAGYK